MEKTEQRPLSAGTAPRYRLTLFIAWSSFPEYLKSASGRPAWLRVDRLLGEHGIPKDSPAGRQWTEEDLPGKAKTDRHKAGIALRLRRETTMTLAWMAGRLQMGSVNTLKNTLRLANSRD